MALRFEDLPIAVQERYRQSMEIKKGEPKLVTTYHFSMMVAGKVHSFKDENQQRLAALMDSWLAVHPNTRYRVFKTEVIQ